MTIADALLAALPEGTVLTDPDLLAGYRRDEADLVPAGTPVAVVRPRGTREVVTAVRIAAERGVPIVPHGARTGLTGAANAVEGALVLALTGMCDYAAAGSVAKPRTSGAPSLAASAVRSSGICCDSRSAATRAR